MLNPKQLKKDFPIFQHNPNLVYLDSSATSLKPQRVIRKITEYYEQYSANIHRGIYKLSERASIEYENTREIVSKFIHANSSEEIIFTRNATEGINLLTATIGLDIMSKGDEIVITIMEHHANFVPWQQLAFAVGADFKVINLNNNYELQITNYESKNKKEKVKIDLSNIITKKTKIFAITYVSNTLGTINPVKEIITEAKKINPNIIAVVDAAQAIAHMKIDVQDLGCDFLVFSSHKMLGPTGVGVLWGKFDLLEKMPPYQFGGDMIRHVKLDETTFNDVPYKFEAGTPNIAGVIGLKVAIEYLEDIGIENIHAYEKQLTKYAICQLMKAFGEQIKIFGPSDIERRAGIVTFHSEGTHPHDIAQILDEDRIAVRAGHHCTMPLHTALGVPATTRASFYIYNDEKDVEKLIEGLKKVKNLFSKSKTSI